MNSAELDRLEKAAKELSLGNYEAEGEPTRLIIVSADTIPRLVSIARHALAVVDLWKETDPNRIAMTTAEIKLMEAVEELK